ncbi:uncharacterized protein LOC124200420 isoform X2 [Daphnia pulex]|uniref:uncharacterized protein LOC124200420 isoform X2 n=1 Tax=Daphnia pulex TaxID=6669 RepID=UPI001EDFAF8D|nr:uncharacterized protein LOC124200420 isoform X2 [Daphnia pulex]
MKGLDGVLVQSHSSLISFSSSADIHFSISSRDPVIMRGIFLVLLLVLLGVTFTSTGIVDRISNPIKSYFNGFKTKDSKDNYSIEDPSIFTLDDLDIPESYAIKPPVTINKNKPDKEAAATAQKKRPVKKRKPSAAATRPRPSTATRPRPSVSTRPRPSSVSKTRRRTTTTKRPRVNSVTGVILPESGELPVTGAHAVVATHMGEISVFTSDGRLWLNGPGIPKPVPLGSALDSDSIAAGNKDSYHIWVNTTSWTKLVSLEEIRRGRSPVLIKNDPRNRVKAMIDRKPLDRPLRLPLPPRVKGTYQYDTCGKNIILPLTADRTILMEQAIKPSYESTKFPEERDYPMVCTWNVKVNKACRRARITMKLDERSRLPDEDECAKGYLRISPFMNETKICGRIDSIPAFHWYVEDQQPNDVSIMMKNIGINDGFSEGLAFTLQGECLPIERGTFDVGQENREAYTNWMDRLLTEASTKGHGATISIPASTHQTPFDPPILPPIHLDDPNQKYSSWLTPAVPAKDNIDDALTDITTLLDASTNSTNTR